MKRINASGNGFKGMNDVGEGSGGVYEGWMKEAGSWKMIPDSTATGTCSRVEWERSQVREVVVVKVMVN